MYEFQSISERNIMEETNLMTKYIYIILNVNNIDVDEDKPLMDI